MMTAGNLQKMRRDVGVTQTELSLEIGVSQSYVARIENGSLDPKLSIVNKIIAALNKHRDSTCSEIMTTAPISVNTRESVSRAVQIMRERNFSQLPVLRAGNVVGLITERDIIRNLKLNLDEVSVEAVMSPEGVPILDEVTQIDSVIPLFETYQAIVVQKHGRLMGIITRSDLLRLP
ncbi:MAG: CBS domain-containing protein [Candidatus Thorarchaeota archaeon]|jgi:predicted transcriptional regulator